MATDSDQQSNLARCAAFSALSASGRPEAAEALAPIAVVDEAARSALRAMGELAIPVLTQGAQTANMQALDDLASIGTPAAAEALAGLLWLDEGVAIRAAWWLAKLLVNPDVEEGLKYARIDIDNTAPRYDWIWQPFTKPGEQDGDLRAIVGRAGYLIESNPTASIPESTDEIDLRIVIPIVGLTLGRKIQEEPMVVYEMMKRYRELFRSLASLPLSIDRLSRDRNSLPRQYEVERYFTTQARSSEPSEKDNQIYDVILTDLNIDNTCRTLMNRTRWPVRAQILAALFTPRMEKVQRRDWLEVERNPHSADRLWGLFTLICISVTGGAVSFAVYWQVETARGVSSFGPRWSSWVALACLASSLPVYLASAITWRVSRRRGGAISGISIPAAVSVFILMIVAIGDIAETSIVLISWVGWVIVAVAFLAVLCGSIGLGMLAARRSRRFGNPLRQCLYSGGQPFVARTSVIAK